MYKCRKCGNEMCLVCEEGSDICNNCLIEDRVRKELVVSKRKMQETDELLEIERRKTDKLSDARNAELAEAHKEALIAFSAGAEIGKLGLMADIEPKLRRILRQRAEARREVYRLNRERAIAYDMVYELEAKCND